MRAGTLCAVLVMCGCTDAQKNQFVIKFFEPRRTPQQQMLAAFAAEDSDQRRAALAKVAKSKVRDADWAIKGYVTIALLDSDPQARCVAIRALARGRDPRALETLLKLLNHRDYPPQEVRPPDELCRWDATAALADLAAAGAVAPEQLDPARQAFIDRLRLDTSPHVRLAAARGLSCCPHEESVRALIERMDDENFAVVHQCEDSLARLTGVTQHCDAQAWKDWLAENESDLFAHAGDVPPSRAQPYRNRLEKMGHDLTQFVRWLVPGSKE